MFILFIVISVVGGGLRGGCCVGGGLLCLAPRGTLESSDRDCLVWVDVVEVRVHMLLQMESCDAVDMDVRPLGGKKYMQLSRCF